MYGNSLNTLPVLSVLEFEKNRSLLLRQTLLIFRVLSKLRLHDICERGVFHAQSAQRDRSGRTPAAPSVLRQEAGRKQIPVNLDSDNADLLSAASPTDG